MTQPGLTPDEQRALLAAVRGGQEAGAAAAALGLEPGAVSRATALDPMLGRSLEAAADPALRRGRWRCPGYHCGSFTGFQYGCRLAWCSAAVAPESERRRRAAGSLRPETTVTPEVKDRIISLLKEGATIAAAIVGVGTNGEQLRLARHADPDFDMAVTAARGGWGLRKAFKCPGPDCGTPRGVRYGCASRQCREADSARARAVQERAGSAVQRLLGDEHKRAYLELVRAGMPLTRAARNLGWAPGTFTTARRTDDEFDRAVMAAAVEAKASGTGSAKSNPRRVSRLTR